MIHHLQIVCIKGPSFFKQQEKYQLKLQKLKVHIHDLKEYTVLYCDPKKPLCNQKKCQLAIKELAETIHKKIEVQTEFDALQKEWYDTFDEDMFDDFVI